MLVFVNYTHFSKIYRNYASPFYFKFGKNTSIIIQHTSKWQTHLLHLHLETFKSHNYSLKTIKTQTQNQHTDAKSWVRITELVRYAHALSSVKKSFHPSPQGGRDERRAPLKTPVWEAM